MIVSHPINLTVSFSKTLHFSSAVQGGNTPVYVEDNALKGTEFVVCSE